jgi:hypothetical protein
MPKKPRKYVDARLLGSDSYLAGVGRKSNVGSAMIDFRDLSDTRPYPTHEEILTSQMTSYAMDAACELRQTSKPLCID